MCIRDRERTHCSRTQWEVEVSGSIQERTHRNRTQWEVEVSGSIQERTHCNSCRSEVYETRRSSKNTLQKATQPFIHIHGRTKLKKKYTYRLDNQMNRVSGCYIIAARGRDIVYHTTGRSGHAVQVLSTSPAPVNHSQQRYRLPSTYLFIPLTNKDEKYLTEM